MFALGIIGTIFTVYSYFKNPQIDGDKRDALAEQSLKFYIESTDRRFADMQSQLTESLKLATNHIHTVDTKVDKTNEAVIAMGKEITRLGTIIEERIPKK